MEFSEVKKQRRSSRTPSTDCPADGFHAAAASPVGFGGKPLRLTVFSAPSRRRYGIPGKARLSAGESLSRGACCIVGSDFQSVRCQAPARHRGALGFALGFASLFLLEFAALTPTYRLIPADGWAERSEPQHFTAFLNSQAASYSLFNFSRAFRHKGNTYTSFGASPTLFHSRSMRPRPVVRPNGIQLAAL